MVRLVGKLIVKSVFKEGMEIPKKYTCDGENVNPPLEIEGIPQDAKSIVLIVEDPDAPRGIWVHWLIFNIASSGEKMKIEENSIPGETGMNDFKTTDYRGPCPPNGTHRYIWKVYALDNELSLSFATKPDVELAMKDHVLAKGELMGKYR